MISPIAIDNHIHAGRIRVSSFARAKLGDIDIDSVLERYFSGDWGSTTDDDRPHAGWFLMAAYDLGANRVHIVTDHRVTELRMDWE